MPSIQDCLAELGCDLDLLQTCQTLDEEWALVRKAYFRKVLKAHPDKGESSRPVFSRLLPPLSSGSSGSSGSSALSRARFLSLLSLSLSRSLARSLVLSASFLLSSPSR
jgi:hypothetical protein